MQLTSIGTARSDAAGPFLEIDAQYRPALQGLAGFSHLNVLWWFSEFATTDARAVLEVPKPYANAPDVLGIFATRAPVRPNPIALTTAGVSTLDLEHGIIRLEYFDAHDGSPILDLKPYTPSADRIEHPRVPDWCAHWPSSYETSGDFDWTSEFTF